MIEVKTLARTIEKQGNFDDEELFILGGKMAGICYMPEDYFDSKIQNVEKALSRANMTCGSGHHSVFDHGSVTLQLSGIPKILAMILNSTEQYTTSEKSARYTVMKPETALEQEIYDKWKEKFKQRITEVYGSEIDEKTISKLALENARYMISVFTPTHMAWTTTYRQLAYAIQWLEKLMKNCSSSEGKFNQKLAVSLYDLIDALKFETSSYLHISDNKNREIEFMPYQMGHTDDSLEEYIGDTYQITYLASFAHLAQAQRHRTLHYEMWFKGDTALEYGVYIPPIIKDTELEKEWLEDFEKVAYCYPQGTLVKVVETGRAVKFFEKCKERLCGRAQLEIMRESMDIMQKFIDNKDKLSPKTREQLEKVTLNSGEVMQPAPKCCMNGINCTEHCIWGAVRSFERLI